MSLRLLGIVLLCSLAPLVLAQVDTGTIAGTVTDPSGAAISAARVTIRNEDTNLEIRLVSNGLGQYVSPPLAPGPYGVTAEATGFSRVLDRMTLTLNQRAVINLSLAVGTAEQAVTVTAEAVQLESETSTLGNLRTAQSVRDLPLNGRNFAMLLSLSTGVVPAQTQVQSLGLTPARGSTANNVNGTGFRANQMLIDGLDNTETHNGQGVVIFPPIDAVQEFNVQTSVPSAEFGRGGGNIVVRLKSGTTEFHGVLFEFLRNSAVDAKNFFDGPGTTPPFRMNQFGAALGGPVFIPHLLSRSRDKTFFFVHYEGLRQRQAQTFVSTVPTAAFRRGDFSLAPNRLYDPATARPSGQSVQRDPFPNNVIPEDRLDPVGRNLMNLYPDPNLPGLSANYRLNPPQPNDFNNVDAKIDHRFSDHDFTFYRYSRHLTEQFTPGALPAPAWGSASAGLSRFPVHQFVTSYTHLFSSSLVNEGRAGVGRLFIDGRHANYGVNVADQVGIPGINGGNDPIRSGLPQFNISGLTLIGDAGTRPAIIVSENWQYSDNLSWYHGAHTFKFGGEILHRRYNLLQTSFAHGVYTVSGVYTQNLLSPAGTGFGPADLLLGVPANATIVALGGTRGFRRTEYSLFVQDSWKLTQSLTLNWGLRDELFPSFPWVETHDRQANFLPQRGDVFVVNTPDLPQRSATQNSWKYFGPRLGLAWKLGSKTVARAAYGIYYQGESVPETNLPGVNPPFTGSSTFINNSADFANARRISQGFPLSNSNKFATDGAALFSIDPAFRLPYTQQWNAGVQRQLSNDMVLSVNYVGTKGTRLVLGPDINQARPGPGAATSREPFPRFGAIAQITGMGSSIYHSLQATAERRMSRGLSMLLSYTWAHAIDNGDFIAKPQDTLNLRAERGNGATDVRHHFSGSWTWELPFGTGRKWLSGSGRALDLVLGGWQVNGIASLYTGLPFTVTSSTNTLNGSGTQRADRVGDGTLPGSERSLQRFFDISAFRVPGLYQFGNAGVNILSGPGTEQVDGSLFKIFALDSERRRTVQFRAEFFNLANTPQFNNPGSAIGSPGAGQISSAGSKVTFQRTSRQIQFALKLYF